MRKLTLMMSFSAAAVLGAGSLTAQTYTTADPPILVPDNAGFACQSIVVPSVPGGDTIGTVTVASSVAHSFVGDLTYELRNPGGSSNLTLLHRPGRFQAGFGNSADLQSAVPINYSDTATSGRSAEDEGEEPVGTACASTGVVGTTCGPDNYIPAPDPGDTPTPGLGTNLAQYAGTSAPGTWMLCVADSAAADTGTLASWSLTFTGNTPVELMSLEVK